MPRLDGLYFLLVAFFQHASASQLIIATHNNDQCTEDQSYSTYITYATPIETLAFTNCETVSHSANLWNRGQVACQEDKVVLAWYMNNCDPGDLQAAFTLAQWAFDSLLTGGCINVHGSEYAQIYQYSNLTNETIDSITAKSGSVLCTTTSTTNTTSTSTTSTTNSSATTTTSSTNTTITPHPPSEWYNPNVEGGNTTTTTTTANKNNLFFYGLTATYMNPGDHFVFHGTHYAPGGDYMFTGVATTLTTDMQIGQTWLNVATTAGFQVGDTLLIGQTEMRTISGFGSILLSSPLLMYHAAGASVVVLVASYGASGGDPVARFGDVHREFWLPTAIMHPIIRTPEMNIMASTFAGEGKEQWFGRMVITSAGGFKIAEISIKKDLENFNKSRTSKNAFETLDVSLGQDDTPMEHMPSPDFYFHRMGVAITFMRMSDMKKPIAHQFKIQRARRDVVMIACKTAHFLIAASPASEFANWRPDLSVKYSHLDIIVTEMHNRQALKGILPELWGLKPMSNRTKSFLEPIYLEEESENSGAGASNTETTTPMLTEQRFLAGRKTDANPSSDVEEDGSRADSGEDSAPLDSCGLDSSKPLACAT